MGLLSPSISTQFANRRHSRILATNRRALALRLVDSVIGCVLASFLLSFLWFGFGAEGRPHKFIDDASSAAPGFAAVMETATDDDPIRSRPVMNLGSKLVLTGRWIP